VKLSRPKGPELKMPEVKVPDFLADLYYDLRDRRLLPLLALVLVAIVATPFLLGQKSETELPPAAAGAISALRETSAPSSALTVVEAEPGLREYQKRLRGRKPTDPFRPLGGGSKGGGGSSSSGSTSTTSTSTTTSTSMTTETSSSPTHAAEAPPSPAPPSSSEGSGGGGHGESGNSGGANPGRSESGGSGGGESHPHAVLYTFAVNLQIVHTTGSKTDGNKKTSKPEIRDKILPTTVLPGQKKQVVTYMGLSPKTRKPLFLVSTDVTGVFGEGKCVAGSDQCQLIELEPGFPETFEYGEGGERYKVKVTGVKLVIKGKV
jgi:hypothetical protein